MKYVRIIVSVVVLAIYVAPAKAQPGSTLISGIVAEKENLELAIYKTANKRTEMQAEYKVFPASPGFAFVIPFEKGAQYKLVVTLMKQGHRRLEVDKRFDFPLQVQAGQNLLMKIIPSRLATANKGIAINNTTRFPDVSFVSGNLVNSTMGGPITIQRVENGHMISVAKSNTNKTNKRFQLAIPVKEEGFYYVSSSRFRCRVYLKPADQLELSINAMSGVYELINGSEESKAMEKWQKLSQPITDYGYNLSVFQNDSSELNKYILTHQKLQPAIADFKVSNKLSNERFNHLFDLAIDLDNEYAPMYLFSKLTSRRGYKISSSNIKFDDPHLFYKQFMQPKKFSDAGILGIGEAMSYINLYQTLNFGFMDFVKAKSLSDGKDIISTRLWREDKMRIMMNAIANDTIKAFFLKDQMEINEVNNLSEFRSIFQPFEKYTFPTVVKEKYHQVYEKFIGDTAFIGKSSYDFLLPDTSGRMVSMKDFKGKVILIDVWATWCGPCRGQFPYLKEIEEEYRDNKDMVFVGISTDKIKDKQKWLKTIQKEKLAGVQLLDDFGKAFGRKYEILSIPRFLLIDKQGNWIEIRCPMPEAKEELKRYLDNALQENSLTVIKN